MGSSCKHGYAPQLLQMLMHLCCLLLCRLNLRENEFEDEGAATLARGLATLPALQVRCLDCRRSGRLPDACGMHAGFGARDTEPPYCWLATVPL